MVAISLHSIVPVRTEPREGAEQSTQMLFGELCQITDHQSPITNDQSPITNPNWSYVRLENDGQEGWVDAKMICPMKQDEYAAYSKALKKAATVVFPMAYAVSENNGQTIPLTAGTKLTNYQSQITNGANTARFEVLGVGFRIDPSFVAVEPEALTQENLLKTLRFFINVPYLWGGKNALGMDCSGFTQVILGLFGKHLLRNASEQATQGELIADLKETHAGDLAFFTKSQMTNDKSQMTNDKSPIPNPPITHVGIIIDPERIIHCSGRVKVEKLDSNGIFNAETGQYSHHLVEVRRV